MQVANTVGLLNHCHQHAALELQQAINSYCGEELFVHCRENHKAGWLSRVANSPSEHREEMIRISRHLLRVAPDIPRRAFVEQRSFSLFKESITVITDALHHQWYRTLRDFQAIMVDMVNRIRYWRDGGDGVLDGYGYHDVENKLVRINS